MSGSYQHTPSPRPLAAVTLTVLLALLLLAALPRAAPAGNYCNIWVPGNTDCASVPHGGWWNGYFDQNEGIDKGNWLVCEHTYIYGTGTTVSRRCGNNPQYSGWDLMCYYVEGRELSGHVGNNNNFAQEMEGSAYIEAVHCV